MPNKFKELISSRRKEYKTWKPIYSKVLNEKIEFTLNGFNHLRFRANNDRRNPREAIHKLNLLPFVREILLDATEIENYRKQSSEKIEYWSFKAIPKNKTTAVRVVLKRVDSGKLQFWSVMGL